MAGRHQHSECYYQTQGDVVIGARDLAVVPRALPFLATTHRDGEVHYQRLGPRFGNPTMADDTEGRRDPELETFCK